MAKNCNVQYFEASVFQPSSDLSNVAKSKSCFSPEFLSPAADVPLGLFADRWVSFLSSLCWTFLRTAGTEVVSLEGEDYGSDGEDSAKAGELGVAADNAAADNAASDDDVDDDAVVLEVQL